MPKEQNTHSRRGISGVPENRFPSFQFSESYYSKKNNEEKKKHLLMRQQTELEKRRTVNLIGYNQQLNSRLAPEQHTKVTKLAVNPSGCTGSGNCKKLFVTAAGNTIWPTADDKPWRHQQYFTHSASPKAGSHPGQTSHQWGIIKDTMILFPLFGILKSPMFPLTLLDLLYYDEMLSLIYVVA